MSMNLEKIDTEIANKSLSLSRTQTLSKSVGLESEIRELQRKRVEISGKVDSLNKKVNQGKLNFFDISCLNLKIFVILEIANILANEISLLFDGRHFRVF